MLCPVAGLSRPRKLTSGAQFEAVFNRHFMVHGRFFRYHLLENTLGHARLGLAVSRRVSRRAVQRNRIKRQIRQTFRLHQTQLEELDFVVVAKAGGAEQPNGILRYELDAMWLRACHQWRTSKRGKVMVDSHVDNSGEVVAK